jgi:hypothetical protein
VSAVHPEKCGVESLPENIMATYKDIQAYVKLEYGFVPKSCWIAHMKELCQIPVKKSHNRIDNSRQVPCPPNKQNAIKMAFKHFGLL